MKTETQQIKLTKLEKILELAEQQGATEAEVIQKTGSENPVNFENNKLKTLESKQSSGIFIRLIKNGKIGTASSTDPDALEPIVNSAIESSEFGTEATFQFSKEKLDKPQENINKTPPLEDLVERGTNVIESLKPFHKDLLIGGGFDLASVETIYLNSNKSYGRRAKTIYSTGFSTQLVRGEDFLGIYESNSNLKDFPDEKEIAVKILEKLNYSKETMVLETKKYSVMFTPRAVSLIFANILSIILNGKTIEQKISPLVNKLGKELFDKKLSFIEDPSIGTGYALFDDEGIKTSRKEFIKNGIVNSFYFDLASASRVMPRHVSTGNGFKPSLSTVPTPNLTSIKIEPGNKNAPIYRDIIKNIKEGVLVDQLLGAGQSNTLAGEFSVGIDLGYKIKNGQIQGRIKNCMLAGNIFDVLKNIEAISSDAAWIDGSELLPAFLIENMTVAG